MWQDFRGAAGCWRFLVAALAVLACGPGASDRSEDYLLRAGDRTISARDFSQAFDLAKLAYPANLNESPAALQEARRQLLEQMTTELVMLRRADELGLSITEPELEAAVAAIRGDYPPGVFEQTLIEAAISLDIWKRRLRSRLLMEKLVEAELRQRIVITPEDVAAYYEQHYRGKAGDTDSDDKFNRLRETIVADLRLKKREDAFAEWITGLKARLPVQVNATLWDQMTQIPPAPASGPAAGNAAAK